MHQQLHNLIKTSSPLKSVKRFINQQVCNFCEDIYEYHTNMVKRKGRKNRGKIASTPTESGQASTSQDLFVPVTQQVTEQSSLKTSGKDEEQNFPKLLTSKVKDESDFKEKASQDKGWKHVGEKKPTSREKVKEDTTHQKQSRKFTDTEYVAERKTAQYKYFESPKQQIIAKKQIDIDQETSANEQKQIMNRIGRQPQDKFKGKEITVITNFFPLDISKVKKAYHYDVDIKPDKPKKVLKKIMEAFRKKYFPDRYPSFDGKKNLYVSKPLNSESGELSGVVSDIDESGRTMNFKVIIKLVAGIDIASLNNIGSFETAKSMQAALQCLDVVLRNAVPSHFKPYNRSFFTSPENFKDADIGGGMELHTGFFQSIVLGNRPFLNVDVAYKVFTSEKNIIDLLNELFSGINLQKKLEHRQVWELNDHLKDLKVRYEIPSGKVIKYRVNKVVENAASQEFITDDKTCTVQQYFWLKKNTKLKYPNLPCLWVGSKEKNIYIPCEFCTVLPNQPVRYDRLSPRQISKIIQKVMTNTGERKDAIMSLVANKVKYNSHQVVKEFQLSVSNIPQEVAAQVLEAPQLQYNNTIINIDKGKSKPSKFQMGIQLQTWSILCLDKYMNKEKLERLAREVINCSRQIGMSIKQFSDIQQIEVRRHIMQDLQMYFQRQKFDIIFVILPFKTFYDLNIYNCVKKVSELKVGCITQCIQSNTLEKGLNSSTVINILLKVNAKLNGTNHTLLCVPKCLKKYAMIMGSDVIHPGKNSTKPSVVAVTASCDNFGFKYRFRWGLQSPNNEIIKNLQNYTKELILAYCDGEIKPEQIIYIRNEVSDGSFQEVLEVELHAIKAACSHIDVNYKPFVSVYIVQKRHHTSFFPKNQSDAEGEFNNVPAGTCVDTIIVNPLDFDFYLVSHANERGVSRPTKYRTLIDESNMSADVEDLMYYLCHMYARCCRSVSYPAPTYYAHLTAARAKTYCDEVDGNVDLAKEEERLKIHNSIVQDSPMFFI